MEVAFSIQVLGMHLTANNEAFSQMENICIHLCTGYHACGSGFAEALDKKHFNGL